MIQLQKGFSKETADGLFHLANTVASNIQGKPILATLKPTSAEVQAATDELGAARAMIGPGRAQALAAARTNVSGLLADVAMNAPQIPGITDKDLAQIGLRVLQNPGPKTSTAPEKCLNFQVRYNGEPGTVLGKCRPTVPAVRLYEGQWTLDPTGTTWSEVETFPNSKEFEWNGLERGKDTWFRVRARNRAGAGPWSDAAVIMVA